jgi:toxin FitB
VSGYLLDTNVVSELRRSRKNPMVVTWFDAIAAEQAFISALVVGEIRKGVARLEQRDVAQAVRLEAWLTQLESSFADRVLPVDTAVADRWGRIDAVRPVPVVDGLMAATAIVHDLTLATRNVQHVADTGARLLNPWEHR